MPLLRRDAERGLSLLWEFMSEAKDPKSRDAYGKAISGLHVYLTDMLPASRPFLRARVEVDCFRSFTFIVCSLLVTLHLSFCFVVLF